MMVTTWQRILCCISIIGGAAMLAQATGCNDQTPVGHETDERMSEQPYWVEEVATDLDLPRAAVWLPDGDILIAEWAGKIRRVRSGKKLLHE